MLRERRRRKKREIERIEIDREVERGEGRENGVGEEK